MKKLSLWLTPFAVLLASSAASAARYVPQVGTFPGRTTVYPTTPTCSITVKQTGDIYSIKVTEGDKTPIDLTWNLGTGGDSPFCHKIKATASTEPEGYNHWGIVCQTPWWHLITKRLYVRLAFAFVPDEIEDEKSNIRKIVGVSSTRVIGDQREHISCDFSKDAD